MAVVEEVLAVVGGAVTEAPAAAGVVPSIYLIEVALVVVEGILEAEEVEEILAEEVGAVFEVVVIRVLRFTRMYHSTMTRHDVHNFITC